MSKKDTLQAGKKFRPIRTSKGRKEIIQYLCENYFDKFNFSVLYGRGGVKNHIAISYDNPVSLCGRFCDSVGTEAFVTPLGSMCYVCQSTYEKAFKAWLGSKVIDRLTNKRLDEALTAVESTIRQNPDNWVKAVSGITI
jgi:hypothetical protein